MDLPRTAPGSDSIGHRSGATPSKLTRAEALVVHSLLAAVPESERDRIRRSGLSPRTYEVARSRILAAGWVVERYLPDPRPWGATALRFLWGATTAAEARARAGQWASSPSCLLAMESDGALFGMFRRGGGSDGPSADGDARGVPIRSLIAELGEPSMPIFFDFEGAWSRVIGAPAPTTYPRSLPRSPRGPLSTVARADAAELVRRPFRAGDSATLGRHLGSLFGYGHGSVAARAGAIERRAFLSLARLPAWDGWQPAALSLVHGNLRPHVSPERLYGLLLSRSGMTPFLYATDRRSVLLGALSPVPRPGETGGRDRVSGHLRASMDSLAIVTLPASNLHTPAEYRFDRLLGDS